MAKPSNLRERSAEMTSLMPKLLIRHFTFST